MSIRSNKVIDIADFHASELLPFLKEILLDEQIKFGLKQPVIVPDSKVWECAMMLRAFSDCGKLKPGATFAGIGAGIEQTTYALAARGCVVFPSDRYLEVTPWSDVAPSGMMVCPEQYSNFKYSRGNIIPVHSDCRWASLPSNFFDGVYSAGSIEHVGSLEAVAATAEEMGRILKPGGIACLSTEFRLMGPNNRRWFDDNCILFTPDLIQKYIAEPAGLEMIDEPNFQPSQATFDHRVVLLEFLEKAKSINSIEDKKNAYPNLTLFHEGFLFCSVHLALRKPDRSAKEPKYAAKFSDEVLSNSKRSASIFARQIGEWTTGAVAKEGVPLSSYDSSRIAALESQIDQLLKSRSMRITRPLRSWANYINRTPFLQKWALHVLRAGRKVRRALVRG